MRMAGPRHAGRSMAVLVGGVAYASVYVSVRAMTNCPSIHQRVSPGWPVALEVSRSPQDGLCSLAAFERSRQRRRTDTYSGRPHLFRSAKILVDTYRYRYIDAAN